ncbi:DUF262 domain-containing protein [Pseudomonas oryzihabitans]|uniref:Uncharacterized conserved protein, contains ParB-like and HNH nuclease domains n=2 Tax=cellular organisms TaxID=131567 RepID=A0A1G5P276_9PSED|nr:DUF262 domain-containing protein [Pseudomonas psychrotolerans]NMY91218.1 DUF262 domain-containing protein [Pseudomonas psychrotolerans]SCZ43070.1 Uncharacterized conserved protein, contains ParB-like and HNH nuclease domains [Pseudomonas psychrotolerans]
MSFNLIEKLTSFSKSIGDLLSSNHFEIPDNQREYRWSHDELEKIWDDLILTIEGDIESNSTNQMGHFLGAIVVIGNNDSDAISRWKIIDGQQRLTTITILMSCMLHYIEKLSEKRDQNRFHNLVSNCIKSAQLDDYTARIKLNRENIFYKQLIVDSEDKAEKNKYLTAAYDAKSEVQENLVNASNFFYKAIDEYIKKIPEQSEAYDIKIKNIIEALTRNFYILVVRTNNLWMAYRLFETLNERGLELSQADLIKNIILQHAKQTGSQSLENVNSLWSSLIDYYEDQPSKPLDLPQIIQFSYAYRHQNKKRVKKEQIFDFIAEDLRRANVEAVEFAREFTKDASNWRSFLLGEIKGWDQEVQVSQQAILGPLWKSHCAPFIMAAIDKYAENTDELKSCIRLTENYLFRQGLICKDSVSALQEFFTEAARTLKNNNDLEKVIDFFVKKSPDESFKEQFCIARVSSANQGIYIIKKIEKYKKNEILNNHSLEYILPKKPGPEWGGIEKSDTFKLNINKIGNLLLVEPEINRQMRNKAIRQKLSEDTNYSYKQSDYFLCKELIEKSEQWLDNGIWSFSSIQRRQDYIAEKYANIVWPMKA